MGQRRSVRYVLLGAGVGAAGLAGWWFGDRAPYPYAQRRLLDVPLPGLTRGRIDRVLTPRPGERILEIGAGTGLQSVHVAPQLGSAGRLDALDIQQDMLDHVARRAARAAIGNIHPTCSDARQLPYPDGTFDAAYAITALGEIEDPMRALSELRRVLKPGGRLVVGEFFDRHQIPARRLQQLAEQAGFRLDNHRGVAFSYLSRFVPAA